MCESVSWLCGVRCPVALSVPARLSAGYWQNRTELAINGINAAKAARVGHLTLQSIPTAEVVTTLFGAQVSCTVQGLCGGGGGGGGVLGGWVLICLLLLPATPPHPLFPSPPHSRFPLRRLPKRLACPGPSFACPCSWTTSGAWCWAARGAASCVLVVCCLLCATCCGLTCCTGVFRAYVVCVGRKVDL